MNLMSAMGGISDKHIEEFARVSPKRGRIKLWAKIASAAACLAVVVAGVPMIRGVIDVPFSPDSSSSGADIVNGSIYSGMSHVVFNGKTYVMTSTRVIGLPNGSQLVGEILSVDPNDWYMDGYAEGCHVGDPIYQHPNREGELYVYTTLDGGEYYRYLGFSCETNELRYFASLEYSVISMDGKYYTRDPAADFVTELPEGYVFFGTVPDTVITFEGWLETGDKVYRNPDLPGEMYIYSRFSKREEPLFMRFIDLETYKQEGHVRNLWKGRYCSFDQ